MTTVTLLNGAKHSLVDTIFAMRVLENLRACDVFAFTIFIDHCREQKSKRDVKPAIRDVAQSLAEGDGFDMLLVNPVRLKRPEPGQRISSMNDLWDLDLTQGPYVNLIDYRWKKKAPEFGRLWMKPPQAPDFELFAQIEMQNLAQYPALVQLEPRDFENPHTRVFFASTNENHWPWFDHHSLAQKFSVNEKAHWARSVISQSTTYQDALVVMTAKFYLGLANARSVRKH